MVVPSLVAPQEETARATDWFWSISSRTCPCLITHDSDAVSVLVALRQRDLRIGLLSNTFWPRAFHEDALRRDGLIDLIDARFYTSEMAFTKPHPEVFGTVLGALSVSDPGRAVFVGDRPFDDVFGAQRAGMRAVLRPNPLVPAFEVEPDAVIATLSDLLAIVDRWRERRIGGG